MKGLSSNPHYNDRLLELYRQIEEVVPVGYRVRCGPVVEGEGMLAALFDERGRRTRYSARGRTREQAVLELRGAIGNGIRT